MLCSELEGNFVARPRQEDGDEGEGVAVDGGVVMHPALSAVNISALQHSSSLDNPAMSTANLAALQPSGSMPTSTGVTMQGFETGGSVADINAGGTADNPSGTMDWMNVFSKFGVDYYDGGETGGEFGDTGGGGGTDGAGYGYNPGYGYGAAGGTGGDTGAGDDEPSFF